MVTIVLLSAWRVATLMPVPPSKLTFPELLPALSA
jgi:hypothetical protein